MSQANPSIGSNKPGLTYRNEDNAGKLALLSSHKGSTAPSYAVAGTIWLDDNATPWLLKIYDGSDWITFGAVNATTNAFTPFLGTSSIKYLNYAADTGVANAYAVAPTPAISTYTAGQLVTLRPSANNTGASTLAVSGLSAANIKLLDGDDPHAGALLTSGIYHLVYDGTNFVLLNPSYAFGSAAFVDVIDEDDMDSDSETRPPSQQSVKAFVEAELAANAGGAMELLEVQSISGAEFVFKDLDSAYDEFFVKFDLVKSSASQSLRLQASTDNGATWDGSTSDYKSNNRIALDSGTVNDPSPTQYGEVMTSSRPNSANTAWRGSIIARDLFKAAGYPKFDTRAYYVTSTNSVFYDYERTHTRLNAATYNAFKLYAAGGTIAGTAKLYGIKGA
ncbi:MAG TPA: hypothetical protein PLX33_11480 [Alphaproteobacteria bacterium]|nr:hypothetical protein [Alphaproteobacteria bacterium]